MMKKIAAPLSVVVTLGLLIAALSIFSRTPEEAAAAGKKPLVVQLSGTATGVPGTVPDIDGDGNDDLANCFTVDLIDISKDKVVGSAVDCLAEVTEVGDGLALVGTTYFNFNNGQLVSRGLTTVQPVTHGSPGTTHITGAIPPATGSNDILSGTGAYKNASGSVRLSGAVNMANIDKNEIAFDCLFVITLD